MSDYGKPRIVSRKKVIDLISKYQDDMCEEAMDDILDTLNIDRDEIHEPVVEVEFRAVIEVQSKSQDHSTTVWRLEDAIRKVLVADTDIVSIEGFNITHLT